MEHQLQRKPPEGTKVPPIIIQHSECGHLTFGDEKDGKSQRPRDVGLYGGDSQTLHCLEMVDLNCALVRVRC